MLPLGNSPLGLDLEEQAVAGIDKVSLAIGDGAGAGDAIIGLATATPEYGHENIRSRPIQSHHTEWTTDDSRNEAFRAPRRYGGRDFSKFG